MRTIVFAGEHKQFSGLRLAAALVTTLLGRGEDAWLASAGGDLPTYLQLPMLAVPSKTTAKSLESFLKKQSIERVISFAYLPVCQAAAHLHVPFVYVEPENFKGNKIVKNKKELLAQATRVVVIGTDDKPISNNVYPVGTVRVANPAIWVEHYNYQKPRCFKKENNIVAAGPFNKEGGFDVLLETWARLAPAHPTWHLTLVGYGTGKDNLQKFIAQHMLQQSTELMDAQTDLYSLLRNADIYVNPARTALGLNELLDAMASKLPVISTDVPGADHYVQNSINGVLVNIGEEEPLTVALDELMVNWGKRVGMAIEASKHKERFPFDEFYSKVLL